MFTEAGDRSIEAQVHELVGRFEHRECTPAWLVHPTTPTEVRDSLEANGWVCAETLPESMALPQSSAVAERVLQAC